MAHLCGRIGQGLLFRKLENQGPSYYYHYYYY